MPLQPQVDRIKGGIPKEVGMQKMKKPKSKSALMFALLLGSVLLAGCVGAGNFIWLDENGNGIQDAGEPGAADVGVTLFNSADDAAVATTNTDADGQYTLVVQGVTSGTYYVGFDLPVGVNFTMPDQGNDDEKDSDADPSTGLTPSYSLSGVVQHVDAGLVPLPSVQEEAVEGSEEQAAPTAGIGDYVWQDENANGLQDAGEPGVG